MMQPRLPVVPLETTGVVRRIPLLPHQLLEPVTPQRDLFVLAHIGIPRIDVRSWRLEIGGMVERPVRLTMADIRGLPKRRVMSFHQCAGFPRRPDLPTRRIGNVVWGGIDLAALLQSVGVRPEARFLWAYGLDRGEYDGADCGHYAKDVPLERIARGDALLAYEVNGEKLSVEHGAPLRLVVPGYYGTNLVKWLCRIDLADRRSDGLFTTALYNDPVADQPVGTTRPVWEAAPESVIVAPAPGPVPAAGPVRVWGWAWSGQGVERVEVSADAGATWRAAALEPREEYSWQRFSTEWVPPAAGAFTLTARATDRTGATQPASRARNALHTVEVEVREA